MEYDYRKGGGGQSRSQSSSSGYDAARYNRLQSNISSSSLYPRIAQPVGPSVNRPPPPPTIATSSSSSSGTGIKVTIKPIYQVAPPVQLLPQGGEVPRSLFQFDFDLERRILAEAESPGQPSYSRIRADHSRLANGASASLAEVDDPAVGKYIAMGLNKEAVVMAIRTLGDVQNKVLDFCPSYDRLLEMGFQPDAVAAALAKSDIDFEQSLAHLVSL
ncbi:hypothetical protein CY35_02G029900 [Sphagnum magellanicum]|nr:hypothetical protein CY35_02G029900 [Sphagnum magellanicum]KAH9570227.1 hypothetical protein CY35_02G029900 [Sphagnum magellanicum]